MAFLTDDRTPPSGGGVFLYVGTKRSTGNVIEKGLSLLSSSLLLPLLSFSLSLPHLPVPLLT